MDGMMSSLNSCLKNCPVDFFYYVLQVKTKFVKIHIL